MRSQVSRNTVVQLGNTTLERNSFQISESHFAGNSVEKVNFRRRQWRCFQLGTRRSSRRCHVLTHTVETWSSHLARQQHGAIILAENDKANSGALERSVADFAGFSDKNCETANSSVPARRFSLRARESSPCRRRCDHDQGNTERTKESLPFLLNFPAWKRGMDTQGEEPSGNYFVHGPNTLCQDGHGDELRVVPSCLPHAPCTRSCYHSQVDHGISGLGVRVCCLECCRPLTFKMLNPRELRFNFQGSTIPLSMKRVFGVR